MSNNTFEYIIYGTVFVLALLVIFVAGWGYPAMKCSQQWNRSGMNHEYSLLSGCMVEHKPNQWIPADKYRAQD